MNRTIAFGIAAAFSAAITYCGVLPSGTPNFVGNADIDGQARITKINLAPEGIDASLDFSLEFKSSPQTAPGMLGPYWHIPFFSSGTVKLSPTHIKWIAPNGASFFFNKATADEAEAGSNLARKISSGKLPVYTDNFLRFAAYEGENFVKIEDLNDPAIYFIYKGGILSKFGTGKKSEYDIEFAKGGKPTALRDLAGRKTLMRFEYHQDGRHVKKITVGSAAYEFEYCERAEGDMIAKSHAADKSCRLLAKIKYPDKSEDTFSYMRTPGAERRILLENFSSETVKTNANRMTQKNAAGAESWVEWCESTGIIMADSGGKYSVGNDRLDSEHPRANPNAATPSYITLQYAPYKGGNRELFHYNWMKLEEIKGGAGGIFRYVKMAAKGTNYLNDRRVEKLRPGSSLNSSPQWDLQKLCHYDQFGRIIRSIDAAGDITEWKYFTDSQELEKKTENGRLVYLKTLKDNGDSEETEWRKGSVEKSIHLAAKNATVKISEENGLRHLRYYKDNQLISSKTEEIK